MNKENTENPMIIDQLRARFDALKEKHRKSVQALEFAKRDEALLARAVIDLAKQLATREEKFLTTSH